MSCSRQSVFLAATDDPPVRPVHVVGRRCAVQATTVREPAPGGVHLGQVGVVAPVAAVDELQQPGARRCPAWSRKSLVVERRFVTMLGEVGPRVGRTKFCSAGSSRPATIRTASSSMATTCGKASRKKPEIRTVTSMRGRAEFGQRDGFEIDHPARRVVPDRPDPSSASTSAMSSPEVRMADVPPPTGRPSVGQSAVVVAVAGQQRIRHRRTGFPGQPRRHGLGVHRVEVAPGGQHIDQTAQRGTRRTRGDEAAVQCAQHLIDLPAVPASRGTTSVAANRRTGRRRGCR